MTASRNGFFTSQSQGNGGYSTSADNGYSQNQGYSSIPSAPVSSSSQTITYSDRTPYLFSNSGYRSRTVQEYPNEKPCCRII